jgi:predicted RNA binding protein YcfA (HicA-like mRNA interferase family)
MSRLPRITGKEMIAALAVIGFEVVRVKGSHHFVRHTDGAGPSSRSTLGTSSGRG